jgi:sortase A
VLKASEAVTWTVALACLGYLAVERIDGIVSRRDAIQQFAAARAAAGWPQAAASPDLSAWSPERIEAWQRTSTLPPSVPLAMLRIPRIDLSVPVLEGSDDVTLNRAVGHIEDTAIPGSHGNSGIAGHRDGFFRGLKDVATGDTIELETQRGTEHYRIEHMLIVDPTDVWVLDPTSAPSLTLVTCYPFYFVGSAPKRFIIRAVRVDHTSLD